jgi:hypothetical protein
MSTMRSDLQKQAQGAVLQYAIFRWETALILALALILTFVLPKPFPWWPRLGWPLLGFVAIIILVYSSLTDADANSKVLLRLFQEQFDPKQIQDRQLRGQMESALEYQRRIEDQVRRQPAGLIRDRLDDTASQITEWVSNIYGLSLRLDVYRRDDLLARERNALPKEISTLTAQRKLEANPSLQSELDEVIASKGKHWASLRELDERMQQGALQLEQSLTALATVYSQIQLIDAQSVGSGRAERLQADIREQIDRLNDLASTINDVYHTSTT